MELKKLFFVITFVIAVMVGCSGQKIDSFLSGENGCSPPCWNSITPGLTTQPEAIDIVSALVDKQSYSISESDIYVSYESKNIHIHASNINQIIDMIDFDLDDTLLESLIAEFGEPNFLSLQLDSGGCTVLFYYPDKGVHFMGQCKTSPIGNDLIISQNTRITRAFFTQQDIETDDLLVIFFNEMSAKMMQRIILWDGYKNYPVKP